MVFINKFITYVFLNLFFVTFISEIQATNKPKVLVSSHIISYNSFFQTVHVIGMCKYLEAIDYYAQNEGKIDYLKNFSINETITENSLILGINSNLVKYQAELSEGNLKAAEKNYKRDQSLFKKNIISEETLDKSKVNYQKALYEMEVANKKYKENVIRADFSGKIGSINFKINDNIQKGQFLFSITKDCFETKKVIFIDVSEKLYKKISTDTEFIFYDLDNVKRFATIASSSNYLSDKGVIQIKVYTEQEANLIHKSFLDLDIIFDKQEMPAIPEKSILRDSGGHYVYKILDNGSIEKIYVQISTPNHGMVQMLNEPSNLKIGDQIVLEGVSKIQSNSIIEIQ